MKNALCLFAALAPLFVFAQPFHFNDTYWHNGFVFYHATVEGDSLFFEGGTLHEGGYGMNFAIDGNGTIVRQPEYADSVALRYVDGAGTILELFDNERVLLDRLVQYQCTDTNWGCGFRQICENELLVPLQGDYSDSEGHSLTVDDRRWIWREGKGAKADTLYISFVYEYDFPVLLALGHTPDGDWMTTVETDTHYDWRFSERGLELYATAPLDESYDEWQTGDLRYSLERQIAAGPVPGRWPFTSTRLIMNFSRVSPELAGMMMNEIFARHGYVFKNKKLQRYFERQPWYRRVGSNDIKLGELEMLNVETLHEIELSVPEGE